MPLIVDLKDAAQIRGRTLHDVDCGVIGERLSEVFPDGFNVQRDIYLNTINSEPLSESDLHKSLEESDVVYVVTRQMGGDTIVGKVVKYASFGIGFNKVMDWLYPLPDIPEYDQTTGIGDTKPQNNLPTAQTNLARPFGAIPELFGEGNAYPDLIQPAVVSYDNNKRVIKETFCLGVGSYTIVDTYDDTNNTDLLNNYTVMTYGPGSHPSSLSYYRMASDIKDVELRSTNDVNVKSSSRGIFVKEDTSRSVASVTFSSSANTISFSGYDNVRQLGLEAFDTLTVSGTTSNNVTRTILSISYSDPVVTIEVGGATLVDETTSAILSAGHNDNVMLWFDLNAVNNMELSASDTVNITDTSSNNSSFTISSIDESYTDAEEGSCIKFVFSETVVDEDDSSASMSLVTGDQWSDWFVMPSAGSTIRFYLVMPQGLIDADGNKTTVTYTLQAEKTLADGTPDGTATTRSSTGSFVAATQDRLAKHFDWSPADGNQRYRVRARRTNDTIDGGRDLLTFEGAGVLQTYSTSTFNDVTIMTVERRENNNRSGSTTGRFNVDYIRKLPDWTPSGGYSSTLTDSKNGFRAALYQHVEAAGYALSGMDVQHLYDIYNGLSDDLGQFSASFDDVDMGHADRMANILNSSRVSMWRDGQIWRFWRNEPRPVVASFDIRNLTGQDSVTHNIGLPDDYDSVAIQYRDPDSNEVETVYRRINKSTGDIIDDEKGDKLLTINLIGCRNSTQATDRADLEIRQILNARTTVTTEAVYDWKYVSIGDVVRWADIYDSDIYTGEIKHVSGSTYTTSNPLPQDSLTYYGTITDDSGAVSSPAVITVTGDKTFTASFDVTAFIASPPASQCGSRYMISSIDDMTYSLYSVLSIEPEDNSRAKLTLINYDEDNY